MRLWIKDRELRVPYPRLRTRLDTNVIVNQFKRITSTITLDNN